jgi:hypothetical protein
MSLKPSDHHFCSLSIREIDMIGKYDSLIVSIVFYFHVSLNVSKCDLNQTVIVCDMTFRQVSEDLNHLVHSYSGIMLLRICISQLRYLPLRLDTFKSDLSNLVNYLGSLQLYIQ